MKSGVISSGVGAGFGGVRARTFLLAPAAQGLRGTAADHRVGVGPGGDQRVANRYHEQAHPGNLRRMPPGVPRGTPDAAVTPQPAPDLPRRLAKLADPAAPHRPTARRILLHLRDGGPERVDQLAARLTPLAARVIRRPPSRSPWTSCTLPVWPPSTTTARTSWAADGMRSTCWSEGRRLNGPPKVTVVVRFVPSVSA